MSARRLQQAAPISASECKLLGTSIVTTLAMLPDRSDVGLLETDLNEKGKPPIGQSNENVLDDGGLACGGATVSEPPMNASVKGLQNSLLNVQNIRADFEGSHIPESIVQRTQFDHPNIEAVQKILRTYDQGSPVNALIEAEFPDEDFQHHLIAYLRNTIRTHRRPQEGSLEARLMDVYVKGLKDWCAAALDLFISRVERDVSIQAEHGEAAYGLQRRKSEMWNQVFFASEAASCQRGALKFLVKKALKDNPRCRDEWRKYDPSLGKGDSLRTRKELRFISWILRNSSPKFFVDEVEDIAHAIKGCGGPSHLVNLLKNLILQLEDVAEYKRLKKSVQGADLQEVSTTYTISGVPITTLNKKAFLRVIQLLTIKEDFDKLSLPPFLHLGYGIDEYKTEVIDKIIEYEKDWRNVMEANELIRKEFKTPEQFHAHLFALLRAAMRNYAFLPKLSRRPYDSIECDPDEAGTSLGRLLHMYVKGLQRWCAGVHQSLAEKVDDAIKTAYQSGTEESNDFAKWINEVQPAYTQSVNWLMDQIDLSSVKCLPSPPRTSLMLHPLVADLRQSTYILSWLIRNLPWDCFLFFRSNLASLVRDVDRGRQGFSFLANIFETLSFRQSDEEEFRQYHAERLRVEAARNSLIKK